MCIIVGLGNPGEKYQSTRHNVGFIVLDALAKELGLNWETNKKFKAKIAMAPSPSPCLPDRQASQGEGRVRSSLLLVKPQTYMNNSGQSVQAVLAYYKLLPKKLGLLKIKDNNLAEILTVIHDDLDITLGKYKVAIDSRSAGHNGVQSIIDQLATKNFKRVRIGIRTEAAEKIPADKFVLQKLNKEELKIINKLVLQITKEI